MKWLSCLNTKWSVLNGEINLMDKTNRAGFIIALAIVVALFLVSGGY